MTDVHFRHSFINADSPVVPDTPIDVPLKLNTLQSMAAQSAQHSTPPLNLFTHS
jgi:hypothetical protein